MSMISGSEFLRLCEDQHVYLHGTIAEQLRVPYSERFGSFALLEAIHTAGQIIRHGREDLSTGPIELTEDLKCDTAAATLCAILNSPQDRAGADAAYQFTGADINVGTCSMAEPYFHQTLTAISKVSKRGKVESTHGSQIIMADGAPIITRKSFEEASGLTLAPVAINGYVFPPGSLIAMQMEDGNEYPSAGRVETLPADAVQAIAFKRLSDFALRPDERDDMMAGWSASVYETKKRLSSFTVEHALDLTSKGLARMRRRSLHR